MLWAAALSVAIDAGAVDAEMARAVENQVADLDVVLVSDTSTASVVVRLEGIAAGVRVSIRTVPAPSRDGSISGAGEDAGVELVREVHARPERRDARSAALRASALREAVALAVRGALQALLLGERVEARAESEVVETSAPEAPPADRGDAVGSPEAGARSIPFFASAGWRANLAASGPALEHAIAVRGGLLLAERWEAALEVGVGLPLTLTDERTAIDLSRHRALASLGARILERDAFALAATAAAGLSIARRSTSALQPGVTATPARTRAEFLAAAELRLRLGGALAFELSAGADFIPGAPILTYTQGAERLERAQLFQLQPKIGLAIYFSSP